MIKTGTKFQIEIEFKGVNKYRQKMKNVKRQKDAMRIMKQIYCTYVN